MSREKLDGMYLVLLGCAVFVLFGSAMEHGSTFRMSDFKDLYYASRCALQHHDPYLQSQLEQVYRADGGTYPSDPWIAVRVRQCITLYDNLPPTLLLIVPIALMPFGAAEMIWIALTAASLIVAALLAWDLGAEFSPRIAGGLVFLVLAGSEVILIIGNIGGIVVSLVVIAAWCFIRERFVLAGTISMAIALVVKPHDAGLVWLYFLLAGGIQRKRALNVAIIAAVLVVSASVWTMQVSPQWIQELKINLSVLDGRGGIANPGESGPGLANVISLQAFFSVFLDDPRFYNLTSLIICAVPFFIWLFRTLRQPPRLKEGWFALASIACFTMLPVYHRSYDAKLLLLTIPACALLWAERPPLRWTALVLSSAAILLTGDLFWAPLLGLLRFVHLPAGAVSHLFIAAIQSFPVPLSLFVLGAFYLWIYMRPVPIFPAQASASNLMN
jgi:hypothetical protein